MTSAKMTPRERVQTALSHEEPDFVPLALGGGPYGIVDDLYLRTRQTFGTGRTCSAVSCRT